MKVMYWPVVNMWLSDAHDVQPKVAVGIIRMNLDLEACNQ
jgi:hypothetical protein